MLPQGRLPPRSRHPPSSAAPQETQPGPPRQSTCGVSKKSFSINPHHLEAPDREVSSDGRARPNILPAMLAMIAFLRMVFITLKLTQRIFPEKKSGESDSREKRKPCKGVDDRRTTVAVAVSLQTGTEQRLPALPLQTTRVGPSVLRERRKLCCCVHLGTSQISFGFSPSDSASNSKLKDKAICYWFPNIFPEMQLTLLSQRHYRQLNCGA